MPLFLMPGSAQKGGIGKAYVRVSYVWHVACTQVGAKRAMPGTSSLYS